MGKLFGTDGVRGIANQELTAELAYKLGLAGVYALSTEQERPVLLIGKDTRISGDMLEDAISAGILSMGGNVIKTGVLPTPAIAYLVRHYQADAGVVISASHNPFEYNGIKFFNGEGFKLDDDIEAKIEDVILNDIPINSHITGDKMGKSLEGAEDAMNLYTGFLKQTMDMDIRGMRLVIDGANGAAYEVAERVFTELGAEVTMIGNQPDGININDGYGSTHPENLQRKVLDVGANLGLAFDGDADRLIAVDEQGGLVDGDKILYICSKMLKSRGELRDDLVTATVMSNMGLTKALEAIDCRIQHTTVGDRYVLERMQQTGSIIGGEQSGHIIFLNNSTTGDGILAAIQLIKAMMQFDRDLSELSSEVTIYPQVLKNATVQNVHKHTYMENARVNSKILEIEENMAGEGRVLIRPSGTEPLVRVMLEGSDLDKITTMAEELTALIVEELG